MYDKRDDKKEAVQAWQRVADTINSLRRMQSGIVWNIQNSHFRRQLRIWESVIPLSRRGYERPERTKERTNTGIRELFQWWGERDRTSPAWTKGYKGCAWNSKKAISILGKWQRLSILPQRSILWKWSSVRWSTTSLSAGYWNILVFHDPVIMLGKKRVPSATEKHRGEIKQKIRKIYEDSHQNYGAPKITRELWKTGEKSQWKLWRITCVRWESKPNG